MDHRWWPRGYKNRTNALIPVVIIEWYWEQSSQYGPIRIDRHWWRYDENESTLEPLIPSPEPFAAGQTRWHDLVSEPASRSGRL